MNSRCFNLVFVISLLFYGTISFSQTDTSAFRKSLADSLGADDYGMRSYILVILKSGSAEIKDKTLRDSLFKGHMQNIQYLVKQGKMIVAGPFQKNELSFRGLFILNVKTVEEAKQLIEVDPTVSSGIFECDYIPWYGSAALPLYLPFAEQITRKSF